MTTKDLYEDAVLTIVLLSYRELSLESLGARHYIRMDSWKPRLNPQQTFGWVGVLKNCMLCFCPDTACCSTFVSNEV